MTFKRTRGQIHLRLRRQACSFCHKPGHNIRRHYPPDGQTWFDWAEMTTNQNPTNRPLRPRDRSA
jgi:hypothetical protein